MRHTPSAQIGSYRNKEDGHQYVYSFCSGHETAAFRTLDEADAALVDHVIAAWRTNLLHHLTRRHLAA